MIRVLRYLGVTLVAICILACWLAPIVAIGLVTTNSGNHVIWFRDGSSVGLYFDGQLLIRRRGFGPEFDHDTYGELPLSLLLLAVPPLFWFFKLRSQKLRTQFERRLLIACAVSPLSLALAHWICNVGPALLCFAPLIAVVALTWGILTLI